MGMIDDTAIIYEGAELAEDVVVGPQSIISSEARIASGTEIGARVLIEGKVEIGKNNKILTGAVIGTSPQDWSYEGNDSGVKIGDQNILREYITINRATESGGYTQLGDNNMIMTYSHIAHDCVVGNNNALANGVTLAGHVEVHDHIMMGGLTPVHQFVRIGSYAMVGGLSRLNKDVPPYIRISGNPARVYDLNSIGLRRHGVPEAERKLLKRAVRILFYSDLNTTHALEKIEDEVESCKHLDRLIEFVRSSERGIHK